MKIKYFSYKDIPLLPNNFHFGLCYFPVFSLEICIIYTGLVTPFLPWLKPSFS